MENTKLLNLIKTKEQFDEFITLFDWHDAFLKEQHHNIDQFLRNSSEICISTVHGSRSLHRLLIALPNSDCAVELAIFNEISFACDWEMEIEEISATFSKTFIDVDFCAFEFRAASVGYSKKDLSSVGFGTYYADEIFSSEQGEYLEPYALASFKWM